MTLTIPGRLPALNDYVLACRGNKYVAAKMKASTERTIATYATYAKLEPVKGPYTVAFEWVEPNKRRDPDNIAFAHKFILDALVGLGIVEGDGWKHNHGMTDTFSIDRDNPRVVVRIEAV